MIDHATTTDRLSDYVDGALTPDEAAEVERHMKTCASCARDVDRLHALLATAAVLPRTIDPPAALWPAIRQTLEARKGATLDVTPRSTKRQRIFALRWLFAASVLVVATAAVSLVVRRAVDDSRPGQPVTAYSVSSRNASVVALMIERRYVPTLNQLAATLRDAQSRPARKPIPALDRSLVIVDSAIAETRAALVRDPGNRDIADLLAANYQRKLDLLKRATELTSEQ